LIISTSEAGREALPLPEMPRLTGNASNDWIIRPMCQGPGVQVVAKVPCEGPVPPPSIEVTPDINECSICCGQMKWMWLSNPPAVRIFPFARDDVGAGADHDGHRRAGCRDCRPLPMALIHAFLDRDIGLDDAPVVNNGAHW